MADYVVHNFNWLPLSLSTVDGGWSQWGEWSRNCSDNCTGEMERFRQCGSPRPVGSGKYCEGRNNEIQPCPCPGQIKGGYRPVFCSVPPSDYVSLLTFLYCLLRRKIKWWSGHISIIDILYLGLIISGGIPSSSVGKLVEIVLPSTDLHCTLPDLPTSRWRNSMEKMVVCGGGDSDSGTLTSCLTLTDTDWETTTTLLDGR